MSLVGRDLVARLYGGGMADPEGSWLDQFFTLLRERSARSPWLRVVLILLVPLEIWYVVQADSWVERSYFLILGVLYAYVAWRVLRKEP